MKTIKTALVTGTSSGIGLWTAIELAKRGWKVYGTTRTEERKKIMLECTKEAGVEVCAKFLDITSPENPERVASEIIKEEGGIDLLVNNAGAGLGGFLYDTKLEDFYSQLEVSFFGTLRMTKAVLPNMVSLKRGKIITVSSISGIVALPGLSAYAAAKFALEGLMESLRHELFDVGIDVVLIEPGVYKTDIYSRNRIDSSFQTTDSPFKRKYKQLEAFADNQVARHGRDPREVASVIAKIAERKKTKLRNIVGSDAKMEYLLKKLLPQRMFEAVMRKSTLTASRKFEPKTE
jgi:short-subunit dehydrogenase